MLDFESLLEANPKAKINETVIREAFGALDQLRQSGIVSDEYDLAPPFGGNKAPLVSGGKGRAVVKMGYSR